MDSVFLEFLFDIIHEEPGKGGFFFSGGQWSKLTL